MATTSQPMTMPTIVVEMSDINEVRERLFKVAVNGDNVPRSDMLALLADHARLQADSERLDWLEGLVRKAYVYGASFDFAKSCEGEQGGYRFMTRQRLDARQPTLRAAIDAAKGEGE